MTTAAAGPRREYRSARRREQAAATRATVLAAATMLFGERGWASTGMRDVAREAGVSVETVYANFRSKADLLMAAIDVAVVGDAEEVPLARRDVFAALGRGSRTDRLRAGARMLTDIQRRTAGVNAALREAAASDPDLDRLMRERETHRLANVAEGIGLAVGRPLTRRQADALWAVLDVGVYRMLTDLRGWTSEDYEEWVARTIDRLVDEEADR